MEDHVTHKLRSRVGIDKRIERMSSTEGVPEAESAVIGLPFRHLFDFEIGIHISPVHVAHRVWLHENMIESGVENGLLLIGSLDIDARQLFLPCVMSGLGVVREVPTAGFG